MNDPIRARWQAMDHAQRAAFLARVVGQWRAERPDLDEATAQAAVAAVIQARVDDPQNVPGAA